jgi:hypothetical protein
MNVGLDGPGFERRWEWIFSGPSRPGPRPTQVTSTGSFLGAKAAGGYAEHHPLLAPT